MTVTTTLLTTGIVRSPTDQSVKLSAVLNNRVSAEKPADSSVLASQSTKVTATPDQYPPLNLRVDTVGISRADGSISSIDTGALQVSRLLDQLQSLATLASLGGLSETALQVLSGQFQALRRSVSNVPPTPPQVLEVASVLGEIPGGLDSPLGKQAIAEKLTVGGLNNDKALLGDASIDTPELAKQALGLITTAFTTVDSQRTLLAKVKETIDFAAVSTEAALENQAASRSTLTEADLDGSAPAVSLAALLQANSNKAQQIQTKTLPNDVLSLIS